MFRYDTEIDVRYESTHTKVLDLVGLRQRVLELGCGTGHMTKVLRERGCHVVGVEVEAEAAKYAAEHCEHMIVGDLDEIDLGVELGDRRFDVIVAADVLEHLKEPESALERLRPFLAPGGYLVVSIPNVGHGSVRLALLGGTFTYTDTGLLDRTHLRFYTRQSMVEMLAQGGFTAVHVDTIEVPVDATEVEFDATSDEVTELVIRQPDALVYQFVVLAFPSRPPLSAVATLLARLNRDRDAQRDEIGRLLVARNELDVLRPELDAARTELVLSREALTAVNAELAVAGNALAATAEALTRTGEELAGAWELATRRQEDIGVLTAEKRLLEAALQDEREQRAKAEATLAEIYGSTLWKVATRYRRFVGRLRAR